MNKTGEKAEGDGDGGNNSAWRRGVSVPQPAGNANRACKQQVVHNGAGNARVERRCAGDELSAVRAKVATFRRHQRGRAGRRWEGNWSGKNAVCAEELEEAEGALGGNA